MDDYRPKMNGNLVVRPGVIFNGVKVFSATMLVDRGQLGDKVTAWIAANPQFTVTEFVVTQSSDAAFHCIAISVFYREQLQTRAIVPRRSI